MRIKDCQDYLIRRFQIWKLRSSIPSIRDAAINRLIRAGEAWPLTPVLKYPSALQREGIAKILGEIKNPSATQPLIERLADPSSSVRSAAEDALKKIASTLTLQSHATVDTLALAFLRAERGDEKGVEYLAHKADGRLSVDRRSAFTAAKYLARLGDARAVERLSSIITNTRAPRGRFLELAREAIHELAEIGDESATKSLITFLQDNELQSATATALGRVRSAHAVETLIEQLRELREPESDVPPREPSFFEEAVIRALGSSGNIAAVDPLRDLIFISGGFAAIAATSLAELGEDYGRRKLLDLLTNSRYRTRAASELGRLGEESAIGPLTDALRREGDSYSRARICEAFIQIGGEQVMLPLIEALEDPSADVREVAILGLGRLGDERAMGPLKEAIRANTRDHYLVASEAHGALINIRNRLEAKPPGTRARHH